MDDARGRLCGVEVREPSPQPELISDYISIADLKIDHSYVDNVWLEHDIFGRYRNPGDRDRGHGHLVSRGVEDVVDDAPVPLERDIP